ncbi:hypothetical protein AVO45_04460 [Ruegeria marisrubri]|uniref:DUF1127 domain-containing protein n=1 Tax=Ruegeria marisrubri TaxID=1685379 RepID=A0A0X3TX94_9RHOB|nr:hypothetical protein [Ruegeria marisrubri]KUJ80317.1 hypothetical protein AVO45_04460 [Ruegeria marisrubri]
MAHSTAQSTSLTALLKVVGDIFAGIWDALSRIGEANAKVHQINAYYAMTNAELAARGIKREDIIRFVMADAI